MANIPFSLLPSGTPEKDSLLAASVRNANDVLETVSVTPAQIVECAETVLTGSLPAGSTQITFQASEILATSKLEFFTDVFGVSPTNVQALPGIITMTFAARSSALGVKVRIS